MRRPPVPELEYHRKVDGALASSAADGMNGAFVLPGPLGSTLYVIASSGSNWIASGLGGEPWEHVSVHCLRRTPTWRELEHVKRLFWHESEVVMQLHVATADHINVHPFTLHLWRPTETPIPTPPKECV